MAHQLVWRVSRGERHGRCDRCGARARPVGERGSEQVEYQAHGSAEWSADVPCDPPQGYGFAAVVALALALLVGCGWPNGGDQITSVVIAPPGGSGPVGTPTPGALSFACSRDLCSPSGACSGIRCTWLGSEAFDLCAASGSFGKECTNTASPGSIDPGPPGAGGADWSMTLERSGLVVASGPVVRTDT